MTELADPPMDPAAERDPPRPAPPLVLVVEDDEALRKAFVILLERAGHEVLQTASGRQAMELLHRRPEVVLCDYMLPDADGIQILATAREAAPDAEFILATAFGSLDVAIRALHLGASDFLTKPLPNMELLVDRVKRGVERHRLKKEVARKTLGLERANAELAALADRTQRQNAGLTHMLSGILDLYDPALGGHGRRVGALAGDVARELGLPDDQVRQIEIAGLLHDVGYLALPRGRGREDAGELQGEHRALLEDHPALGQALLQGMDEGAALLVRHHHERCDGSGRPDRRRLRALRRGGDLARARGDGPDRDGAPDHPGRTRGRLRPDGGGSFSRRVEAAHGRAASGRRMRGGRPPSRHGAGEAGLLVDGATPAPGAAGAHR